MELAVQILHSALCVGVPEPPSSAHWVLLCSPFPLLYVLAQHLNQASRFAVTMLLYGVMLLSGPTLLILLNNTLLLSLQPSKV